MTHVLMPRLGVSVTEGTISAWLKQVGDSVELGEPICEVSTDKVDTEIESTVAGVLAEQRYAEGETVQVGESLAIVTDDDTQISPLAREEPEREQPPSVVSDSGNSRDYQTATTVASNSKEAPVEGHILMPRLGVSVTEGTISAWLKQVGDSVELGEPICEVSTDKVDTEIESTVAGVLAEQRYAEGETVQVGELLAVVTTDGTLSTVDSVALTETVPAESVDSGAADTKALTATKYTATVPGQPAELRPGPFNHEAEVQRILGDLDRSVRQAASPGARRLAAELGVDLTAVTGSGGAGHVTRRDVQQQAKQPKTPTAPAARPAVSRPEQILKEASSSLPTGYEDVPYEEVPTSRIRKVIAEHMTRSRQTAAHMTTEVDVNLAQLTDIRVHLNRQRIGKLSFLPFIARAACAVLLDYRDLNATFETTRLLQWNEINLGIAVDTVRGLMVPVLHGAQRMTIETLGDGITDVAGRVRDGKPRPDDFRGGTFTISNPGSVGAVSAPAIINQPQVAILGIPSIVRRPWVIALPDGQEAIAIRPILRLALTFDHRAVDGAYATRFLVDMRRRLEEWGVDDYR